MDKIVDARNLSCPQPVVLTTKALAETDSVVTIVDNEAAMQNVLRLAKSQACAATVKHKDDGIYLTLVKKEVKPVKQEPSAAASGIVLFIS